ncbi:TB2/DP1, HVA22 family-domain-containing protein [Chytriomyces sp. MP71]|nr:TB2/DP1, HVA22 family-domain-containing protein [Chytriomyces sp. MP71]
MATTVVPPAFTKWSAPAKPKETSAALAAAAVKPPPGLLGEVPKITKDVKTALSEFEKGLVTTPIIMELAHITKLGHLQLLGYLIIGTVYVVLVTCNVYGGFLTFALGVGWPIVKSLRAAEACKKEEVQTWISYWVITAIMTLTEYAGKAILTILPFYYTIKMVFLLWLMIPYFNGSFFIYNVVLKHLLPPLKPPEPPKKEEKPLSKWAYPTGK